MDGEIQPAENLPAATQETNAAANQIQQHVSQAASQAASVAEKSDDEGWRAIVEELKGIREDIKQLAPPVAVPVEQPAAQPEVEVPPPPPRYVRRNGRKVKR